jgi:hypothetical protein
MNNLSAPLAGGFGSEYWSPLYRLIFDCNSAIEGLNSSTLLTPAIKNELLGEAKFLRAFYFFYLTNLFGDIPLPITSDYQTNSRLARTSKERIYQQIISDLKDAQASLNNNYLDGSLMTYTGTPERVRPTKWAASALLARTYLYNQNWDSAEMEATNVINNSGLFSLDSLNAVFLKNSTEAIWQLQPVTTGHNTEDARVFIIPSTGFSNNTYPVYLDSSLINDFEVGDHRMLNWVKSYSIGANTYFYPYKYKIATTGAPVSEYLMVLRLGEQYLIRAEARAEQKNILGAQNDLDSIRYRAGLLPTTANDMGSLLSVILEERRKELFSEWGHRWLDLKRNQKIDIVMQVNTPQKGGGMWNSYQQLYPLPYVSDIQFDDKLVQNPGY